MVDPHKVTLILEHLPIKKGRFHWNDLFSIL